MAKRIRNQSQGKQTHHKKESYTVNRERARPKTKKATRGLSKGGTGVVQQGSHNEKSARVGPPKKAKNQLNQKKGVDRQKGKRVFF